MAKPCGSMTIHSGRHAQRHKALSHDWAMTGEQQTMKLVHWRDNPTIAPKCTLNCGTVVEPNSMAERLSSGHRLKHTVLGSTEKNNVGCSNTGLNTQQRANHVYLVSTHAYAKIKRQMKYLAGTLLELCWNSEDTDAKMMLPMATTHVHCTQTKRML